MTTIAYHHKDRQIAVDSMISSGSRASSLTARKWTSLDGRVYFSAGSPSEIALFIAAFDWGECHKDVFNCASFMVDTDGSVYELVQSDGVFSKILLSENDSIGSGSSYALSAMDFGRSACESVEYAKTRCIYTGGKVHVFDIAKMDFV